MDNKEDAKVKVSLGIATLYEDDTSKTIHLTILNNESPPQVISTIGAFNITFDPFLSKKQKSQVIQRRLDDIVEFRLRYQDKINSEFDDIMKKNFLDII